MDILEWIKERTIEYANMYDSGVSAEMRAGYRHKIDELTAIDKKIRELYGWQPGPPPAEPEDGSQWELDFPESHRGHAQRVLCTFRAIEHVGYSHPGICYEDAHWAIRHRRIMPAPEVS